VVAALIAAVCATLGACEPAKPPPPRIAWHHSVALGSPAAGRLEHGVRLPAQGRAFFTWDPVKRRSPNRPWRRWGTDRLVRIVLTVARDHRAAHPHAPRMAVGDLSRRHGGDFGPRFGYIGHASHQNGLDVDVYYPRADGRERAARDASQIDRRLSQELVDRFLAAGAATIFVGPNTRLIGPPGVVVPLTNHDNHLHVRLGSD
jgi:murein endopeptidase